MPFLTERNKKRMLETFLELVKTDSPSKYEGKMARRLETVFKSLGCSVVFDRSSAKTGSQSGNLVARFPGDKRLPPLLLSAHMDTVSPGRGIRPSVKKDRVVSDGTTVLGADCKSGISIIIEALRIIKEKKLPHPPLEIVITVCEEIGLQGSRNLDYALLKSRRGIVLDTEDPREVTVKAPCTDRLVVKVHGIAAHAGMFPERGISAILVAAEALRGMKLGRIDGETTANFGEMEGGSATNIITPLVTLRGEARSRNPAKLARQVKHMKDCFLRAAAKAAIKLDGRTARPRIEFEQTHSYPALNIPASADVLGALKASARACGISLKAKASGGGSDANNFAAHGIFAPNLGVGMWEPHTTMEYLSLNDFYTGLEIALGAVVRLGGEGR